MTTNERAELAALAATLEAFMEAQAQANADLRGDIKTLRTDLREVQDLRQKIGGMVITISIFIGMIALPVAMFWKWFWGRLTG